MTKQTIHRFSLEEAKQVLKESINADKEDIVEIRTNDTEESQAGLAIGGFIVGVVVTIIACIIFM